MKKALLIIAALALITLMTLVVIRAATEETPRAAMDRARSLLTGAALAKSSDYARDHFDNAIQYYDSAMSAWREENDKCILFRDYGKAREYAGRSAGEAELAISVAKRNLSKAGDLLESRISGLGASFEDFEKRYGNFPFDSEHTRELLKSRILFQEGVLAYEKGNYASSTEKLDSVETAMNRLHRVYEQKLRTYFADFSQWDRWVNQGITHSKKQRAHCIIVDKMARECILYKDGRKLQSFGIELGANWMGYKQQQGDRTTPEGLYRVIGKKSGGETRYYKSFLLDYPNDDDRARFLVNKKSGIIHPDAAIGNLIEIHGEGGKGLDWTDGCIALTDADMDELYKVCAVGTLVTIVGSTRPLDEIVSGPQ
jgi:tetratricopeptide (TPR) repeat protein